MQLFRQFRNCPFDGAEQCARSDAVSNGDIGVAKRVLIKPVVDCFVQQFLTLVDIRAVDPVKKSMTDIDRPISDGSDGNSQFSGQSFLGLKMQKPFTGRLTFLGDGHGFGLLCVQKFHTPSKGRQQKSPESFDPRLSCFSEVCITLQREAEWCPRLDSNQHASRRCDLNTVRLPISPLGLNFRDAYY